MHIGFNSIKRPVNLTSDRKTHQHVIGSSGTGKSKFLEHMIRGDLKAHQGFCLIDPHGTLYDAVLKYCARWGLKNDITLINLSEPEQINGFDFFRKPPGTETSVHVENLIEATLHAWNAENADNTPTLRRILTLIYTAVIDAELNISDLEKLLDFNSAEFRNQVIGKIENDLIRNEWKELSGSRQREFRDEILSAKNRLLPVLTNQTLKLFLGLRGRGIDLIEVMDRQKVVLVNLKESGSLSKDGARLFGSLLTNQFFKSAKHRKVQSDGSDPAPYYLYIDELANFVSIDLANSLDETRKFGLFCILSHQRFGQIDEDMIDALLTNCQIKTVFGGLPANFARIMAEELFIGKLDPKKIKAAIYQTKHWYKYTRDKVYSTANSYTHSSGTNSGSGAGQSSGQVITSATGQTMLPPSEEFFTGSSWLGDPGVTAISESNIEAISSGESRSSFQGQSESESYSESYGEADIPVFVPVPYQELSTVQYYTPEEQLLELTQALKLQLQRHCFIKLPEKETQPLLVPFVKDHYVSKVNIERYVNRLFRRSNALLIEEARGLLEKGIQIRAEDNLPIGTEAKPINTEVKKNKESKNIFDKIKEANPDIDI